MTNSETRLREQVLSIINNIENGVVVTQQDIDDGYYDEDQYQDGDIISGFDYLADALDIEYTISSTGEYRGSRILVAFGGPNIWINTGLSLVEASWWGESVMIHFHSDAMGIDETCEELFQCSDLAQASSY